MMPTKTGQSAKRKTPHSIFDEIADFLATSPARDAVLDYRPSPALQRRTSQLLETVKRHSPLKTVAISMSFLTRKA
jgi:hypothetical protein